jgi:hypothetical protein
VLVITDQAPVKGEDAERLLDHYVGSRWCLM